MKENAIEEGKTQIRRTVAFRGQPLTLVGGEIKPGDKAPNFKVTDNDMLPVRFLRTYKGKTAVILSVPSLDTPVCDLEIRKFNTEAAKLSPDIEVLAVSMDLPFAQKRWCGDAGVKRVKIYSDYKQGEFGKAYGVLIKELRLLARAVFIVDAEGTVRYARMVPEITEEPDYAKALAALKEITA